MKKICTVIPVATLALFFGACSDDNNNETTGTGGEVIASGGGQSGTVTPSGGSGGGGGSSEGVEPPADSGAPDGSVTGTGGTVITDAVADAGRTDAGVSDAGPEAAVTDAVVSEGGTDPGFEACIATLIPNSKLVEMDTAEKMEVPFKAMTILPTPLSNGDAYGPMTVSGGLYGAKIEWNEGAGTEFVNPINSAESSCAMVVSFFGEPQVLNDDLTKLRDMDQSIYTIFRPACMKEGEKYPVITWANGTCGYIHGYAALLSHLASHGYVIIASNSTYTGTPPTNTVQLRSLDYAEALNADPNSIYYQKLDLDKIGAMGHSQGAGATASAASDPRVKALIFWNSGVSNNKPFLNVSGERDLGDIGASGMATRTNGATQPGAWVYYHQVLVTGGTATGHLVLMQQPERVVDVNLAWWNWQLKGDQEAKKMFIGDNCGFCNRNAEFEYGHNSTLQ
ncbi:MAG: hypothetical protein JXA30_14390 [Deltaproteobacteria bacterium]|nr:hypothetical protein [Deltaproteobacteria bacterium]